MDNLRDFFVMGSFPPMPKGLADSSSEVDRKVGVGSVTTAIEAGGSVGGCWRDSAEEAASIQLNGCQYLDRADIEEGALVS